MILIRCYYLVSFFSLIYIQNYIFFFNFYFCCEMSHFLRSKGHDYYLAEKKEKMSGYVFWNGFASRVND